MNEEQELLQSIFEDEDFLEHYGVLGMKWGVRKDKRSGYLKRSKQVESDKRLLKKIEDGKGRMSVGLTKKRQAKYNERDKTNLKKSIEYNEKKIKEKETKKKAKAKTKPNSQNGTDIKKLSNSELRQLNERLQLEKTYASLTSTNKSKGQKFAENVLSNVASQQATKYANQYAGEAIESVINKKKK